MQLPDATTLHEMFRASVNRCPHRPYLGHRPRGDDGTYGDYQWMTYSEANASAQRLAGWLKEQGTQPGDRVALVAPNRPEWLLMFWAIQKCGAVAVCIMNSARLDAIETMLKLSHAKVVITDTADRARAFVKNGFVALCLADSAPAEAVSTKTALNSQPFTLSVPRTVHDTTILLFTSGSSGQPKGVPISHQMALAAVKGAVKGFNNDERILERHLSFLPLGHVAGILTEMLIVAAGGSVAYWHGDVKGLADDLRVARPTLFVAVPRVYQNILKTIEEKLHRENPIKRRVAEWAMQEQVKRWRAKQPPHFLADRIIGKKLRDVFGGNIRASVCGSAPFPEHVFEFFSATLQCPILEGYGLTETTGPVLCSSVQDCMQGNNVGRPMLDVEVKLEPVPEMNYVGEEGEIWVRGPTIFKGYDELPTETAEVLNADGWFRTGDIGRRNKDGSYTIIDRVKNLLKLANGEYVAPEIIESRLQQSQFVRQVFVTAPREASRLVAIVVPSAAVEELAGRLGIGGGMQNASRDSKLVEHVLKDLRERTSDLRSYEVVQGLHLELPPPGAEDAFTVDNGFLTPSLKLRRPVLQKHYADVILRLART